MEDLQQNNTEVKTGGGQVKSGASFAAAQLTIFYLFWIMFFGEVIRWNLPNGDLYRPIRDSFLIPFAEFFIVGHHWVGKIITGAILVLLVYLLAQKLRRYKSITEAQVLRNGYALVIAFWVYTILTLLYFIGHLNKFWFF